MKNGLAVSQEEYAEQYQGFSAQELLDAYATESESSSRCVGTAEHDDSHNALAALEAELLKRMGIQKR